MKHEVLDEMCNCVTIWVVSPSAIGKVRKYEPPSVLPFGRGFCSWKWAYLEWGHSTWRLVLELDLIRSNSWMMNEWLMDFRMENYRKWIDPISLKKTSRNHGGSRHGGPERLPLQLQPWPVRAKKRAMPCGWVKSVKLPYQMIIWLGEQPSRWLRVS